MNTQRSVSAFILGAVILSLLMAGCQAAPSQQASEAALIARQVRISPSDRTIYSGTGAPFADYFLHPQSMQDLVNRYDVAFIGTIKAVGDPVKEKPYDWDSELDAHLESRGLPPFRVRVTYYDLSLDEVFLDDGNLRQNVLLRLFGDHNSIKPQIGEKFFFVLGANPDGRSYGLNADWNLIHLDGGAIRNFDDEDPGYDGVSDENSLKSAARLAAENWAHLPVEEWPLRSATDDSQDVGEPPTPGDTEGDEGPVGSTGAGDS